MAVRPFVARGGDGAYERQRAAEALSGPRRFENMLARHEARLRRLAHGMLTDSSRVDDVLQDAFLRAYRGLPSRFESEAQELAWLYRIVHRTCLNELRSRRRRRETHAPIEEFAVVSPDEDVESLAIAAALAELPPRLRAPILLVDLLGFDYGTAAGVLRVARGTVASRLSLARRLLREALTRGEESGV